MTLDQTIGRRVRARRRRAGITQLALARRIKRHRCTLANIELGRYAASVPTIRALARALKCSVADLIG